MVWQIQLVMSQVKKKKKKKTGWHGISVVEFRC